MSSYQQPVYMTYLGYTIFRYDMRHPSSLLCYPQRGGAVTHERNRGLRGFGGFQNTNLVKKNKVSRACSTELYDHFLAPGKVYLGN